MHSKSGTRDKLNEKAILEDVLKTSSAILLSFNNSVDDLAAAGFEAKKL